MCARIRHAIAFLAVLADHEAGQGAEGDVEMDFLAIDLDNPDLTRPDIRVSHQSGHDGLLEALWTVRAK